MWSSEDPWGSLIAIGAVVTAVVYLIWRYRRAGKSEGGCASCDGCARKDACNSMRQKKR